MILVFLFSFKMSCGKKQRNRQRSSPRSRKKKSGYVGEGSQHKGGDLNNWTTEDMANARALYKKGINPSSFICQPKTCIQP